MKKIYETPISDLIDFMTQDIVNASPIGVADENATGYEDQGDLASVFKV